MGASKLLVLGIFGHLIEQERPRIAFETVVSALVAEEVGKHNTEAFFASTGPHRSSTLVS